MHECVLIRARIPHPNLFLYDTGSAESTVNAVLWIISTYGMMLSAKLDL